MNNLWLHPNNTCFIKSYFTFAYININLISTLFFFQFTLIMATEESIMYHLLLYISLELKHQFKSRARTNFLTTVITCRLLTVFWYLEQI